MSIIFLILPITLLLSVAAVVAFAWATRSGQFDDLETPALRLLHDEPVRIAAQAKPARPSDPPTEPHDLRLDR